MTLEAIANELARLLKDRWDQQLSSPNEATAVLSQLDEWKSNPEAKFRAVCETALIEFNEIDKATPWSPTEPRWWLNMQEVARAMRDAVSQP